ncbi:hypothetical protein PLICRDRAFT_178242 [Plicaturopsis crispa FD-325 SS-3]|nr:hypothetical protein PLICRDRAFT_178242 [Plicaturopsis crispa FD-325 SS-3]
MDSASDRKVDSNDRKGAPFDDPNADIILRSSDNVDFRACKCLLSPSMLALSETENTMKDGLPVIQLREDSAMVRALLRYSLPSLSLSTQLHDSLQTPHDAPLPHPLRVFATAIHHALPAAARAAAKHNLHTPIADWPYALELAHGPYAPELEYISARQYHRLLEYHIQCGEAASTTCSITPWPSSSSTHSSTSHIKPTHPFERSSCSGTRTRTPHGYGPAWLHAALLSASTALQSRPRGATVGDVLLADGVLRVARRGAACGATGCCVWRDGVRIVGRGRGRRWGGWWGFMGRWWRLLWVEIDLVDLATRIETAGTVEKKHV